MSSTSNPNPAKLRHDFIIETTTEPTFEAETIDDAETLEALPSENIKQDSSLSDINEETTTTIETTETTTTYTTDFTIYQETTTVWYDGEMLTTNAPTTPPSIILTIEAPPSMHYDYDEEFDSDEIDVGNSGDSSGSLDLTQPALIYF
jgi:hypothetical protein